MSNLNNVIKFLNKDHFADEIKSVQNEDEETIMVCGEHWTLYMYMIGLDIELEVEDGHCVDQYDIEFFNRVYQEIEEISRIYHKDV